MSSRLGWMWLAFGCLLPATSASAADLDAQRELVNAGTVGIMSGAIGGTDLQIAADLANALDDGYDLRILAIIGKGSVRDIEDLMLLRGIDIAIVQSDVLDFYQRNDLIPGIEDKIRYIAKLYDEEVHVLSKSEIRTIDDLQGRRVNFGPEDGGTYMTSNIVFDNLELDVEITSHPHQVALQKLREGAIDAMVMIEGKPVDLFEQIGPDEPFHFLAIPPDRVQGAYLPVELSADDYPGLITPGAPIEAVGVGEVLAAYDWPPDHPRAVKLARFVDRLFGQFDQLLAPPFHPKWRDVDLAAPLPGWQRLSSAEQAVASQ